MISAKYRKASGSGQVTDVIPDVSQSVKFQNSRISTGATWAFRLRLTAVADRIRDLMSDAKSVAPETMSTDPRPHAPEIEVFAVHGADPEVLAYAMAKYSRSALSMKESLKELNE